MRSGLPWQNIRGRRKKRMAPSHRRFPTALLPAAVCLLALVPASGTLGAVQQVPELGAQIDWSSGQVRLTVTVPAKPGVSKAALQEKALGEAREKLTALLVRVSKGGSGVYAIPGAGDPAALRKLVESAVATEAGPVASGRFSLTVSLVLPRAKEPAADAGSRARQEPDSSQVRAFPPLSPTGEEALLTGPDVPGPFTGLIVDTRGLDVRTSMSPRLLDATLREVYSGAHASADFVEDVGVVGYMGTIAAALRLPRVGARPLVVRAIGTADARRTDAVISLADARRFLSDRGASQIIARCGVCFVVDSLTARDR